jgi:hypothetical protein
MLTKFRPENLKRRDNFRDLDVEGRIILRCILRILAGFIRPRAGTSDRRL